MRVQMGITFIHSINFNSTFLEIFNWELFKIFPVSATDMTLVKTYKGSKVINSYNNCLEYFDSWSHPELIRVNN